MIELHDVTKTYRRGETDVRALRGVSGQIAGGSFTFIVGPSGSGKSTLLYLLGALDQPTSGDIVVQGRKLSDLTLAERDHFRRDDVGFVFQNFNLLSNLTAVENVLVPFWPRGITPDQHSGARDLLRRVGLGERLDHLPRQLSGGEQQRVAIARALLKRPRLILADEPTGELDSESGAEVYRCLRELHEESGATVVVVTHEHDNIRPEDRVLSLRDGRNVTPEG
jgi:putative ABC transport system ATP-binding protein